MNENAPSHEAEPTDPVLDFWFTEMKPGDWFDSSASLDDKITKRFAKQHQEVVNDTTDSWKASPEAALSAIIVLDQFSRNMFRGTAESFAYDTKALKIAQYAVDHGFADELPSDDMKAFMYMPFMHSENAKMQDKSVDLFTQLGDESFLKHAKSHREDIRRDGRFAGRDEARGVEADGKDERGLDPEDTTEESEVPEEIT